MLFASLDAGIKCRACGKIARLDMLSRWMLACLLAILLPMVLLYANVFYSGHLFIVSIAVILGVWRMLSVLAMPILNLELAPRGSRMTERQSAFTLGIIVVAALVMDGFMAYRVDADAAKASERPVSADVRPR